MGEFNVRIFGYLFVLFLLLCQLQIKSQEEISYRRIKKVPNPVAERSRSGDLGGFYRHFHHHISQRLRIISDIAGRSFIALGIAHN